MAYVESDRVWIRRYVGYGAIFQQAEPRLENAVTATQSAADGGSRPDSSTENNILGLVYGFAAITTGTSGVTPGPTSRGATVFNTPALPGLIAIEQSIATQSVFLGAGQADTDVTIDPARECARLRKEGRRLCHQLARMLGMKGVRADIFSSSPVITDDDPFAYSNLEHWRGGP